MNISEKLLAIQNELNVPKKRHNKFGDYYYRSAEDILEGIKPLTMKYKLSLKLSDTIKDKGGRLYVESTAKLIDCDSVDMQIESKAQAVIDFNMKGQADPQKTGSASSYAKKYALGNLFLIDDTQDSDATNTHGAKEILEDKSEKFDKAITYLKEGGSLDVIKTKYRMSKVVEKKLQKAIDNRKVITK